MYFSKLQYSVITVHLVNIFVFVVFCFDAIANCFSLNTLLW